MLIESYTLVAIFYLVYAIALATSTVEHPGVVVFSATIAVTEASQIISPVSFRGSSLRFCLQMIANLFVVYRVLSGRAWTKETERRMKESQISTLRWDSGGTTSGGADEETATQMIDLHDHDKKKSTAM